MVIDDGSATKALGALKVHLVTVDVAPSVGRWRGYHIDNLTTGNVTLTGNSGDTGDYSGPGKDHVIHAATRMNFDVDEYAFKHRDVHIGLKAADGTTWTVSAHVPPSMHTTNPKIECSTSGGACDPTTTVVGQRAAIMSATTSTVTKDAAVATDVRKSRIC